MSVYYYYYYYYASASTAACAITAPCTICGIFEVSTKKLFLELNYKFVTGLNWAYILVCMCPGSSTDVGSDNRVNITRSVLKMPQTQLTYLVYLVNISLTFHIRCTQFRSVNYILSSFLWLGEHISCKNIIMLTSFCQRIHYLVCHESSL